jgi:hypothetical protein
LAPGDRHVEGELPPLARVEGRMTPRPPSTAQDSREGQCPCRDQVRPEIGALRRPSLRPGPLSPLMPRSPPWDWPGSSPGQPT